jgi:hypothetical protein
MLMIEATAAAAAALKASTSKACLSVCLIREQNKKTLN